MKLKNKIHLSSLYFRKHFRRYLFLMAALSFGFAVITVMTSLSAGMTGSLHEAALRHYGGDLVLIGYNFERGKKMQIPRAGAVEALLDHAVEKTNLEVRKTLKRINYFRDGALYFSGHMVRQKNVLGIDWEQERDFLSAMHLIQGSVDELIQRDSILISEAVARQLNCRMGDDLVLKADTLTGQHNTGTFIVRGIFRDTSIFGYYKCFVGLDRMNSLLNYGEGDVSSFGLVLEDREIEEEELNRLYTALSGSLPMAPPITAKEDLTYQLDHVSWSGIRYFLVPLSVYVSQVDELLLAMDLLSYFLYVIMALIILVSISVTYRVILRERTREIGTMLSMGLHRRDAVGILCLEAFWLFLLALLAGALLAAILIQILTLLSYSRIPGFELFLRRGRLVPSFSLKTAAGNIFLLLGITLPAVLVPSLRVSRMALTRALAGDFS